MDIDALLDDIDRVITDGDMRPEARQRAQEALEKLSDELASMKNAYAVFEELAPPDMPRKKFAELCFAAWERESGRG